MIICTMRRLPARALALFARLASPSFAILLSACGGGGGSPAPLAAPAPVPALAAQVAIPDPAADDADAPHQDLAPPPDDAAAPALDQAAEDGAAATAGGPADFALAGYGAGWRPPTVSGPEDGQSDAAVALPDAPAATTPVSGASLYVAPQGSDQHPGTQALPFKTIGRAARAARAGTTVYVARGLYAEGVKTTASGSANARIVYVSTTKWGARIVPPAKSVNRAAWDNRGNYVDIVGFEIDGSLHRSGIRWESGIYNGGSYAAVRNNHVHHVARGAGCSGVGGSGIGIDSYFNGVKSDVIGNRVHDIGPAGCRFFQGIYMSTSGSIKNNVVYRVSEGAIHLWHDATNVIITNNTVTASNTGIIIGAGNYYQGRGPNDNTVVYSNIVYDNVMGISEQGSTGRNNSYRNNLVYQNSRYNWQLRNGITHSGTVSLPPQFAGASRAAEPDLRLGRASPAIGAASAVHAAPTDFDGRARNASTGYDIGAYQH